MSFKKMIIGTSVFSVIFLLMAGCSYLPGKGNLRISVTDTDGNALWGAKVASQFQPGGQLKVTGITEEEKGGVAFNGIKSGKYEFQISRYGYAPETVDVAVVAGKTTSLTVKLFIASPPPIT